MARPTNKEDLLLLSTKLFHQLMTAIAALDEKRLNEDFTTTCLNKNCKDVLMHLYAWHQMMLMWYAEGMSGKKPVMPAEGYTWKTTPALNKAINEKYQNQSVVESIQKVKESHLAVMQLIEMHSNETLFEKKYYNWTGSTSLGAYLVSATSSHYDWALKFLKKHGIALL